MSLAEDVAAVQARVAAAQRERIRAEGARDAAQAAADKARLELLNDFGVNSAGEAETMLAELREELARLTAEISEKLDRIGV